jgi:hypothetical protein
MDNLRPIAKQSIIAKIFEKFIQPQLYTHRVENNLFSSAQHGFVKKKSVTTATFSLLKPIYCALDKKQKCLGLFFDIKKAFDCLNPDIILHELQKIGCKDNELKLFQSYLSDRHQYVELKCDTINEINYTVKSNILKTTLGVPQGAGLSPTLYDIVSRDMIDTVKSGEAINFADDSNVVVTGATQQELDKNATNTVQEFNTWCKNKQLIPNMNKSNYIIFHTNTLALDTNLQLNFAGTSLKRVTDTKFVGTLIDENLNWQAQVTEITKKLNTANFVLFLLKKSMSEFALLFIYYGYLNSAVTRTIIFWGTIDKMLEKIFKIQKKAVRNIKGLKYLDSCKSHFAQLNMLTIPSLFIFNSIMYKRENEGSYISSNQIHNYNTRNSNKVAVPSHKTTLFEKSAYFATAKIYDNLPILLRNIKNETLFENLLKKILINKEYYDVGSFFSENNKIIEKDVFLFTSRANIKLYS